MTSSGRETGSSPAMYRRVDTAVLMAKPERQEAVKTHVRWLVLPLAIVLCVLQVAVTLFAETFVELYPTATLITVLGLVAILAIVLTVNGFLSLTGLGKLVRPLSRAELACVAGALIITAGIPTFGLADALVPIIAAPWNPEWNTPQRGWDTQLHPHLNESLYITDSEVITQYREGIGGMPLEDAGWSQWLSFYAEAAATVPWKAWLVPLAWWMLFVAACYAAFFFLSSIVLCEWSEREKLSFPLAKLPEALLPEGGNGSVLPVIVCAPLFWWGFAFSFLVTGYNALAVGDLIPLEKVPLGMSGINFMLMVKYSLFEGLGAVSFLIIFTAIGLAFLLAKDVSFSVWFYFCVGLMLKLILWNMGYRSFSSDWTWNQSPVETLGMGGILFFAGITLSRVLKHMFQELRSERNNGHRRISGPVVGLAISLTVIIGWICWNKVPFGWAIVFTLFLLLITVGFMRIVAETGIFWLQSNASFFHFYKMLGLGRFFPPVLLAPLIPIYAILFFDIKTFIAPNILNAEKLREDAGASRFRYHIILLSSLLASIVSAVAGSIVLAYARGARVMNQWFYNAAPLRYLDSANSATTMSFPFQWGTFGWFCAGAGWVYFSMMIRQSVFWFPHPIGFLMNINPLVGLLWFSFFIGWLLKKLAVRYGGKWTYDRMRLVMIGLIMGELVVIAIASVVTMLPFGIQINGIDLNRYGP